MNPLHSLLQLHRSYGDVGAWFDGVGEAILQQLARRYADLVLAALREQR